MPLQQGEVRQRGQSRFPTIMVALALPIGRYIGENKDGGHRKNMRCAYCYSAK